MTPHRPGGAAAVLVSIVLLCGACAGTGATTSPLPTPSPAAVATAVGTLAPTVRPTAPATAVAPATPAITSPPPAAAEPPSATLAVEGGDPVTGSLGSYTWAGGGSDSPWLPGEPIHAGPGEPLRLVVSDGVGIAAWSARRAPAGSVDGTGARPLGTGTGPVAFDAPGAGSWSVQVAIRFAHDLGSATYYWRLDVD